MIMIWPLLVSEVLKLLHINPCPDCTSNKTPYTCLLKINLWDQDKAILQYNNWLIFAHFRLTPERRSKAVYNDDIYIAFIAKKKTTQKLIFDQTIVESTKSDRWDQRAHRTCFGLKWANWHGTIIINTNQNDYVVIKRPLWYTSILNL